MQRPSDAVTLWFRLLADCTRCAPLVVLPWHVQAVFCYMIPNNIMTITQGARELRHTCCCMPASHNVDACLYPSSFALEVCPLLRQGQQHNAWQCHAHDLLPRVSRLGLFAFNFLPQVDLPLPPAFMSPRASVSPPLPQC